MKRPRRAKPKAARAARTTVSTVPQLSVANYKDMQLRRDIKESTMRAFERENERMETERLASQLEKLTPALKEAVLKKLAMYNK